MNSQQKKHKMYSDDLPRDILKIARKVGLVAWDIETSGLDWKNDQIGTCQIYIPDHQVHIVKIGKGSHEQLKDLLRDSAICKVFHHAMFDLRFMAYHWSAEVNNVACTRVASRILNPNRESHSLKALVLDYFNASLDKAPQTSNWLAKELTTQQLDYAVADVIYLPRLLEILRKGLIKQKQWDLAVASFNYIPVRVMLDILGYDDLFQYSSDNNGNSTSHRL